MHPADSGDATLLQCDGNAKVLLRKHGVQPWTWQTYTLADELVWVDMGAGSWQKPHAKSKG